MSRVNVAAGSGGLPRSPVVSTKLLASAQSCAQRMQFSLENLGSVSNLLVLSGVGAGLFVSYLSGLIIDRGLETSPAPRLAAGVGLGAKLP